ncbi:MAG: entericidin A/B family lipoprotein [Bradyrhizobium sp.]
MKLWQPAKYCRQLPFGELKDFGCQRLRIWLKRVGVAANSGMTNSGVDLMSKLSFAIIALVVSSIALASCANTVRGVGRDVKSTGHAVKEAVQ